MTSDDFESVDMNELAPNAVRQFAATNCLTILMALNKPRKQLKISSRKRHKPMGRNRVKCLRILARATIIGPGPPTSLACPPIPRLPMSSPSANLQRVGKRPATPIQRYGKLLASVNACLGLLLLLTPQARAAEPKTLEVLGGEYRTRSARSSGTLLECHSTSVKEGELDLERFTKLDDIRSATKTWLKVAEMLDNGEMPPKDAEACRPRTGNIFAPGSPSIWTPKPWPTHGDPGPVVLRRLNNAEYTYTVQDLTGYR